MVNTSPHNENGIETSLLQTEDTAKKSAKLLLKQLQTLSFIDKKINAVGIAITSTTDLLDQVTDKTEEQSDVFTAVKENQSILTDSTSELVKQWNEIIQYLSTEEEQLKLIEMITSSKDLQLTQTKDIVHHINTNNDLSKDRHDNLVVKIDTLKSEIHNLDSSNELNLIKDTLTTYIANVTDKHLNERTELDTRFNQLNKVNNVIANQLVSYDILLTELQKQIKLVSVAVDAIDEKVSLLTPKSMDLGSDEILNMFVELGNEQKEAAEARTKALEEQLSNINIESITNETHIEETQPSDMDINNVEETADTSNQDANNDNDNDNDNDNNDEVAYELSPISTETTKPKKKWKFWK